MGIEQHGYEAGSGIIGAFFGAVGAYFGIKQRVALHSQKLKVIEIGLAADKLEFEKTRAADKAELHRLFSEFKRNTEDSIRRIETAHERHAMLVVYKDKCTTCEDLRDSKHESLEGKLDILLDRIKERRHV
jgi:H2-forming N5,N10-methylenetetrahydromethanopterin dehydrogenase-like enzyme